jgi:hypothetical protein
MARANSHATWRLSVRFFASPVLADAVQIASSRSDLLRRCYAAATRFDQIVICNTQYS